MLWAALAPYDPTLRKIFEANFNPAGWGGLCARREWVARFGPKAEGRAVSNGSYRVFERADYVA